MTIKRQISPDLLDRLVGLKWSPDNNCFSVAAEIRADLGLHTPHYIFSLDCNNVTTTCINAINSNIEKWRSCEFMQHGAIVLLGKVKAFHHIGVVVDGMIYHMDNPDFKIETLQKIKTKYKKIGFYECNLLSKSA